jgi:hypothetical protein
MLECMQQDPISDLSKVLHNVDQCFSNHIILLDKLCVYKLTMQYIKVYQVFIELLLLKFTVLNLNIWYTVIDIKCGLFLSIKKDVDF